jgi:tripartite-type tricarboxylate transporter receptor subunit TctC
VKFYLNILSTAILAFVALVSPVAAQDDYPSRPIKLIVGYVPGPTGPDYAGRVIAEKLTDILGQPVVVENKPGASGTLATAFVARAPADGYTLLVGETGQLEIAPALNKSLPYNTLTDLTPVGMMLDGAGIVFVSSAKTTDIRTLNDLVREAKANPGKFTYGSAGIGSIHHLIMESFKDAVGIDVRHVPYKGGGQAVPGFLGGEVDLLVAALQTVHPHVKSGKARLLAATGLERIEVIPDVPALSETVEGFDLESQIGILGPANLPPVVVAKLSSALKEALESPELREKLSAEGTRKIRWTSPQEYGEIIRANLPKFERAAQVSNIAAN